MSVTTPLLTRQTLQARMHQPKPNQSERARGTKPVHGQLRSAETPRLNAFQFSTDSRFIKKSSGHMAATKNVDATEDVAAINHSVYIKNLAAIKDMAAIKHLTSIKNLATSTNKRNCQPLNT